MSGLRVSPDEAAARKGAGDVLSRMAGRPEDIGAHRRLPGPAPHHGEKPGQAAQVFEVGQLFDLVLHARPSRRPATSDAGWITSATTIAVPKASARPSGSSRARTKKNDTNANNPSSSPRNTATAEAAPCMRWANAASTAP